MQTKTAVSAGGIVFKKSDSDTLIAVASTKGGKAYNFPKGLVEKDEPTKEAALREVKEEANLTARIVAKISVIDYWFYQDGVRYHKYVHFFLMEHFSGEPKPLDKELDSIEWMSINEARNKLSYKGEKQMLEKAILIMEQMRDS